MLKNVLIFIYDVIILSSSTEINLVGLKFEMFQVLNFLKISTPIQVTFRQCTASPR